MPLVFARLTPRTRAVAKAMSEAEQAVAAIYGDAVDALGDQMNGSAMRAALASGNPSAAVAAVSWDGFGTAMGQMGPVFNEAAARAANLPDNLRIVGAFDRTDPRAFAFAQRQAATLVRDITEETRTMIRATVTDAFTSGVTVPDTARRLRSFVGLTERQTLSVGLAQGKELERLLGLGMGRAEAEAKSWEHAARVQDRMVKTRAMTIARTEVARAQMSGRYLSWAQAVEAGTVSPESRKQWLADGANPCDICAPYDNEVVMWDDAFSNGVEMPPAHPNCICSAVLMPPETDLTNPPVGAPEADINPTPDVLDPAVRPEPEVMPIYQDARESHAWIRQRVSSDLADGIGPDAAVWAHESYRETGYVDMNGLLRDPTNSAFFDEDTVKEIEVLRDAIMQAPPINTPVRVYRGVKAPLPSNPGDVFTDPAFMSTSFDKDSAFWFAGSRAGGTYLEIDLPAGTHAVVGAMREYEVVLPPSTSLRVIGTRVEEWEGRDRVIVMCEVVK